MARIIIKSLHNVTSLLGPEKVMRTSLVISFLFHVIILLTFQKAFPLQWTSEELRTYRVELIRPPVENIDTDDIPEANIDHIKELEQPDLEGGQDTISLDTKDKRYSSYASVIKKQIMRHWRYPPEARAYLIEGSLRVLFSLASNGRMTQIRITKTSEHEILDREVIRAINKAAPFPPFPGSITVKRLNIKAQFDYRLTSKKRNS